MKSKTPLIVTVAVAACIVCIIAVLAVKMNDSGSPSIDAAPDTYTDYQPHTEFTYPVYNEFTDRENETTYPSQSSAFPQTFPTVIPSVSSTDISSTVPFSEETTVGESTTIAEKITFRPIPISTLIKHRSPLINMIPTAIIIIPMIKMHGSQALVSTKAMTAWHPSR